MSVINASELYRSCKVASLAVVFTLVILPPGFVDISDLFAAGSETDAAAASVFHAAQCEGTYESHLQGICTNERDAIYWPFTNRLVKTDTDGKILKQISVPSHHGDLCFHDGKLYVAVNLAQFNEPAGKADSWVYVYDADDLSLLKKCAVPQVVHGAGGIGVRNGQFFVVGGLPVGVNENYVYEYDEHFQFIRRHTIDSGYTLLGIQTATFAEGFWWFGCYGQPKVMLKTDESFKLTGKHTFDCSQSRNATDAMARDLFSVFTSTRCQPFSRMVA